MCSIERLQEGGTDLSLRPAAAHPHRIFGNSAHAMRAILLARATAAILRGRRSSEDSNHAEALARGFVARTGAWPGWA